MTRFNTNLVSLPPTPINARKTNDDAHAQLQLQAGLQLATIDATPITQLADASEATLQRIPPPGQNQLSPSRVRLRVIDKARAQDTTNAAGAPAADAGLVAETQPDPNAIGYDTDGPDQGVSIRSYDAATPNVQTTTPGGTTPPADTTANPIAPGSSARTPLRQLPRNVGDVTTNAANGNTGINGGRNVLTKFTAPTTCWKCVATAGIAGLATFGPVGGMVAAAFALVTAKK